MQGATIRAGAYYRCTTRTMAPGAAAVADHPATVNLREDQVVEVINGWIGGLFAPENLDETVATLVGDQSGVTAPGGAEVKDARARHADAETRLRRYRQAIGAGVDPTALMEAINQAQAERAAAQAQISGAATGGTLDLAEVYAMIDSLGDIAGTLKEAKPAALGRLYRELDLSMRYMPGERAVYLRARPCVDSARVRGGTRTRFRGNLAPLFVFMRMTIASWGPKRKPAVSGFDATPLENVLYRLAVLVLSLGPHLGGSAAFVDVPESCFGVPQSAVDGRHSVEEALGDLVESGVTVGEAEQVAAGQALSSSVR